MSKSLKKLLPAGFAPPEVLTILEARLIQPRASVLITGESRAGKTTLLEALGRYCKSVQHTVGTFEIEEAAQAHRFLHSCYLNSSPLIATLQADSPQKGYTRMAELYVDEMQRRNSEIQEMDLASIRLGVDLMVTHSLDLLIHVEGRNITEVFEMKQGVYNPIYQRTSQPSL